jgi:FkbM family methyltransferase
VTSRLQVRARNAAARAIARRLPLPVAEVLRRSVSSESPSPVSARLRLSLQGLLAEGGIPDGVSTFRLPDNPELIFVAAESLVLSRLYWYGEGGWEPELLPWWRHFCRRSSAILELGANVGYFSVQGGRAAPSARYTAVEPHPLSSRVCQANLDLNRVRSVRVLPAAAVPEAGEQSVELLVPSDQLATPTVAFLPADTELPSGMAQGLATAHRVSAVDVRSLLEGVDLVKLDVEGQEHTLLAAARPCLRARRPTIFVEVLPETTRLRTLLAALCDEDGYRCYAATCDRLVALAPSRLLTVRLEEEFGIHDLILSTEDLTSTTFGVAFEG